MSELQVQFSRINHTLVSQEVQASRLDSLLDRQRPVFMKLDAESSETKALIGGSDVWS